MNEDQVKSAKDLFGAKKILLNKKSLKKERGELMRRFIERLNPSRVKAGFKPLTMPRMGRILEGIKTGDLYHLESQCEKAKNYSSLFWHLISPKKK